MCKATNNIYGHPLRYPCDVDGDGWQHVNSLKDPALGDATCALGPEHCWHHIEVTQVAPPVVDLSPKKCVATKNAFGFPLRQEGCNAGATPHFHIASNDAVPSACNVGKSMCEHHVPVWEAPAPAPTVDLSDARCFATANVYGETLFTGCTHPELFHVAALDPLPATCSPNTGCEHHIPVRTQQETTYVDKTKPCSTKVNVFGFDMGGCSPSYHVASTTSAFTGRALCEQDRSMMMTCTHHVPVFEEQVTENPVSEPAPVAPTYMETCVAEENIFGELLPPCNSFTKYLHVESAAEVSKVCAPGSGCAHHKPVWAIEKIEEEPPVAVTPEVLPKSHLSENLSCPRCGIWHSVDLSKLVTKGKQPNGWFYGTCSETQQPVLVEFITEVH